MIWEKICVWFKKIKSSIKATPALSGESVLIGSSQDNIFYSLNLITGDILWTFKTEGGIESSPKCFLDKVFFGCNDRYFYSLNINTGEKIFCFQTGNSIKTSPVIYNKIAVFGSWDKFIYAVNIENGELVWKVNAGDWVQINPVIYEDICFFASMNRTIYALDIEGGNILWSQKTDFNPEGEINVSDEVLIYTNNSDKICALDLFTGEKKWVINSPSQIAMPPAVFDNTIIYSDSSKTICAVSDSGDERICETKNNITIISPAGTFSDDKLICMGDDSFIYTIRKDTLETEKLLKIPFKSFSKPLKIKDDLIIIGEDGSLNYFNNFFSGGQVCPVKSEIKKEIKSEIKSDFISKESDKKIKEEKFIDTPALPVASLNINNAVSKLKAAANNLGAVLKEKEYGYSVLIKAAYNKDKELFILNNLKDCEGSEYFKIFLPLYQVRQQVLINALRQSALLAYGSFAIARISGSEIIVLTDTQLAETADVPEFESILKSIAMRGEDMQKDSNLAHKSHFLHSGIPVRDSGRKLLNETKRILDFNYSEGQKGFEITIGQKGEEIIINLLLDKTDAAGNYMITFACLCGEFNNSNNDAYKLLSVNSKLSYGGFGLLKNNRRYLVVMTDTRILSHTQPKEVRKSLLSIYNAVLSYRTHKI